MLMVREAFLTTFVVPEATADGTGWPPSPDGPTPGETGASPVDAAAGVDAAADGIGMGSPGAASCRSDAMPGVGASVAGYIVVGTVPPPAPYDSAGSAAPLGDGIALEDN